MSDFTKTKMIFVLGLLAALFMLRTMMDSGEQSLGGHGFLFLGKTLEIRYAYYLCAGFLGLAAYFYGLELVSGKSAMLAQHLGNIMYAVAILIPPAYLALCGISYLGMVLWMAANSTVARDALEVGLAVLLAVLATVMFVLLRRRLREKDQYSSVTRLSEEETTIVAKAGGLFEAGLYDLVLVEAFRAVETSLRKLLIAKGVFFRKSSIKDLLAAADKHQLLGEEERGCIQDIRVLRNEVVHEGKSVSRESASRVLVMTRRVVTGLDRVRTRLEEQSGFSPEKG